MSEPGGVRDSPDPLHGAGVASVAVLATGAVICEHWYHKFTRGAVRRSKRLRVDYDQSPHLPRRGA